MDKDKGNEKQNAKTAAAAASKAPVPSTLPGRVAPLFRKIDWFAMLFVFAVIWGIYLYTLAPEQTLEDSGELCTGAFYAGIPHPPGYPFWSIYAWVWTKILWFGNVAWRVEVGESFGSAVACGLVALMVSRGSSMIMEGIEELKEMKGKWEGAICVVSGMTAGFLLGFGGVMWSESVAINRISLFGVVWVALVLTLVMRWIYAPHQRRYLYWAMFCFGICATIHQTLLAMAMGIEIAIAMAQPRLGRDLFFGNSLVYILAIIAKATHATTMLDTAPMMLIIFNAVGIGSIAACIWLTIQTGELLTEWAAVLIMGFLWVLGAAFYFYEPIAGMTNPPMEWGYPRTVEGFFHALTRGQYEKACPSEVFKDPSRFMGQLKYLINGVAEEYSWAFLFVAFLPFGFLWKMQKRERAWIVGLAAVYGCIGVLLTIIMNPSPDRQSVELLKVFFTSSRAVVAILIGYGLSLVAAYMATHYMKFRLWGLIGGAIAVLLAVYTLNDATGRHYFGYEGTVSYTAMWHWVGVAFQKDQGGLPIFGNLILVAVAVVFLLGLLVYRKRAPLAITLGLFAITPLYSAFVHYTASEQRNHWFGFWFGHDMFTPPFKGPDGKLTYDAKLREQMMKDPVKGKLVYPEMDRHTVLYGGTDPGRFCPTYSIFCDSFIPDNCKPKADPTFDRRDVYLITQNALADGTYLNYLRAQYCRSQQIDPPFFSELARFLLKDKEYETNIFAKMVSPLDTIFETRGAKIEKRWRTYTSWFSDKEFTNFAAFAAKLSKQADPVSKWLFENFSKETQEALNSSKGSENSTREAVIKDLNVLLERELEQKKSLKEKQADKDEVDQKISDGDASDRLRKKSDDLAKDIAAIKIDPLFETNRFAHVEISRYLKLFIAQNPQGDTRIRLNRLLLEAAYPNEIATSIGGVYPDREIYMATDEDSKRCFQEYIQDAQQRIMHDQQFPNEQRQVKFGEGVQIVDNHVQVSGQIAVMAINGLLTKVIFDHNPDNEFYIEESFPLDWMFPNLTPFGIIMKINRQPLPELTQDICDRDHEFWSQYSDRLIGNWITYDTPVKDVVAFCERVYMRHDYSGYKGNLKFAHDDEAQKAFSKLRSSIGGIYSWRLGVSPAGGPVPQQYVPKTDAQRRMLMREADFAFKQAFAYCPYSPEAVFRYITLLTQPMFNRIDDALMVAEMCYKLDPENPQIKDIVARLSEARNRPNVLAQVQKELVEMESKFQSNPADLATAFALASKYVSVGEEPRAFQILNGIADGTNAMAVWSVVQAYAQMQRVPEAAAVLQKYVKLVPAQPEGWYNLAKTDLVLGKTNDAVEHLREALKLNHGLKAQAQQDFASLGAMPAFKTLMSGQ